MADEIEEPSPPLPGKVLAARYDLARREGLLDPRPDHAIPKPPPQHDRKKGVLGAEFAYAPCGLSACSLEDWRRAARRGPVAFERFLYSGFRLKVVFIDVSESGRRARAMRGETTKLGSEMIPVWNEATQSYDPVSRHNPHLLHVGPGEALVLVDAENPAHYDFKAAAPTGSFLRRTSTSSEVPARHRLVASEVTEAYARLLAMGDASPWQVRVRPPGTLPRERVERVARAVGIHELMALLDPNGNQKGSRSHTSGQTAIHMSYGTMLQPSPIWTHDDDKSLSPLSDDVAAARTIFAEAKAYAAEMSRLRGSVSVRLNELLLPPSDFAMLKARATTTQHNVLPFADLVGSSAPSAAPHSSASAPPVPSAVEMPVQGAVFTLNGLGKLFGMPHIDDGDEPLLFTHLYPERSLPRGSTFGSFLLVEFGAIIDIDTLGAPGQMPEPLKTINAFAAYARPAFDDAARHVEALRPWADTLRYRARQEGVDEQFFSDAVAFAPHSAFDLAVPCTHGLFPPPVDVGAPVETCEACLREPLRVSLADVFEAEARAERFRNHLRDACEMSKEFRGLGDYPASRVTPRPPVEHFKLAAVPLRPALIASADLDVQDPCLERYSNAAFASVDLELRPRESAEAYAVEQAAVTRFCHERDAMLMASERTRAHVVSALRRRHEAQDRPTLAVVPPAGNSQPAAHNNGASPGGSSKGWGEVPPASADALMAAVSHCAALDDASGARATVNRARMYAQLSVLAVHLDHVVWPRCLSEAEAAMRRISPLYSTEGPSPPTLSVDEATCVQYLEASSASKPTFLASTVAPGRGWLLYRRGHATVLDTPKGVRRALFELALLRFEWDLLELLQPSQLLVSAPPEDADVPEDLLLTGSLRQPPFPVVGGGASVSIATATAAFVGGVRSVLTLLLLAIRRGDRQGLLLLTPALHDALRDPLAFTRTTRRVHPNETRHQFPAGMWDAALDDFADPDVLASCNAALSCLFEASPADAASLASVPEWMGPLPGWERQALSCGSRPRAAGDSSCFELRDRLVLLPYGTNPSWSEHGGELSTFLVVGLFYAKEVHRTHLPFDPRACPALVDIFDRLESTAAGRALRQEIHERLDGHAAEWGIWLKDLHPINVYAAPDLKRQVEAGSLQTGTTASRRALIRRVAFTVFCLRGCVGGLAPATLRLVPAEGWKDETEFNAWFSSQAVSADRDERGARWEDKRVYGTATAMNPRHAGTYSKNIELILKFLDKPSSSTPTFETTVRFLRGAKSDKRKAFPQVGGPLTSLHVASDLANFGLVRHCDVDEMAPLVKALDLGAAAGLRALGLTTHGRTLEAAFCEFAGRINCDWADGGLDSSFRAFMTQNKFSLSARNIENLLCKAVRAEFDFRSKPSHVAVYTALPTLFNAKRWPENTTLAGSTDGLEAETPSAERRRDGSKKRGAPMPLSASSSSSSLSSSSSSSSTRGKGHPAGKRHRRE
ncbi:hypothetical protein JCM8202_004955 [Rhodotorula sphaerocarpa]